MITWIEYLEGCWLNIGTFVAVLGLFIRQCIHEYRPARPHEEEVRPRGKVFRIKQP